MSHINTQLSPIMHVMRLITTNIMLFHTGKRVYTAKRINMAYAREMKRI